MGRGLTQIYLTLVIGLLFILLAGCTAGGERRPTEAAVTPDLDEPVSSDEPTSTPPSPTDEGEGEVVYGEAQVESIDILILESFPVQINVTARGYLSDGCTEIDEIRQERQDNTFMVTITTRRPVDAICIQILAPFEETFSLDVAGLEAGTYTVNVNGVTDTFELAVDNVLPEEFT